MRKKLVSKFVTLLLLIVHRITTVYPTTHCLGNGVLGALLTLLLSTTGDCRTSCCCSDQCSYHNCFR